MPQRQHGLNVARTEASISSVFTKLDTSYEKLQLQRGLHAVNTVGDVVTWQSPLSAVRIHKHERSTRLLHSNASSSGIAATDVSACHTGPR